MVRPLHVVAAVVALAAAPSTLFLWMALDPQFKSRDWLYNPLALLWLASGSVAGVIGVLKARKMRPVTWGVAIYSLLHGCILLAFMVMVGGRPGILDLTPAVSVCLGMRAIMMMRGKR